MQEPMLDKSSGSLARMPERERSEEEKDEEAEKTRNRKIALAISKTMADERVVAELTDDEVRALHMRCMCERIKRCI